MDSFKSTLKAADACVIITDVLSKTLSDVRVVMKPMADGGEGTARAMIEAAKGRWVPLEVTGPLPEMRVQARHEILKGLGVAPEMARLLDPIKENLSAGDLGKAAEQLEGLLKLPAVTSTGGVDSLGKALRDIRQLIEENSLGVAGQIVQSLKEEYKRIFL